jgi:serine/threonine protein kinase
VEKLGEGGMGVVYKAEDTRLKRTVALKFLPTEFTRDPEAKERFIREAQAASALEHTNICTIYEIDETEDGRLFIVMACYEGNTLKEHLFDSPLPVDQMIDIAAQIAEGLRKAHGHGTIHRDIKSANILLTQDGVVKVLDFGLAKLAGQTRLTKASTTIGTVSHMSPEQCRGEEVDHRTDIWSLGVVLYEMLTGHLPFRGDYDQAVIYSILNEKPKRVSELEIGLSKDLEQIVHKTIAKNKEKRYQNLDELLAELEGIKSGDHPRPRRKKS